MAYSVKITEPEDTVNDLAVLLEWVAERLREGATEDIGWRLVHHEQE